MDKMIIYTHSSEILFPSLTGVIRFLIQLYGSKKTISENMEFPSLTGVIRFLISIVENTLTPTVLWFPSLTGVIRFLILPSKTRMATGLKMRFAGQNYF